MTTRLKLSELNLDDLESLYEEVTKDFLAVKVRDLFLDIILPCAIYYPAVRKAARTMRIVVMAEKGQLYEHDFHEFLAKEEIEEVFIRKEDEGVYYEYLIANAQKVLKSSDTSTEKKTEILYNNAEAIVEKVYRERPTRANIAMGEQLIGNFAAHVSTDKVTSHALLSLFSKDYHSFSHCVQVALLGMAFCRFMRWKPREVKDFGLGALFHDVGKNAIPDEILKKPSRLDASEFDMIKKHSLLGYQQIKDTQKLSKDQLAVVLHHHEARDGSGYPHRLKDDSIHKYARVARIVDVFDALTTKRVYKDALPRAEALKLMNDEMRHTFDPKLFDAFREFIQAEERAPELFQGHRINIEMGSEALVQAEEAGSRMKAILVGMEPEKYMVFRIRGSAEAVEPPACGTRTAVGYSHAGSIYRFQADVLAFIDRPFPLLILSYPKQVERIEHRKTQRITCSITAEARIGNDLYKGVMVDLSVSGCRFVTIPSETQKITGIRMDEDVTLYTDFAGKLHEEQIFGKVRNARFDQERCVLGILFVDMREEARQCIDSLARHEKQARN
jgi:HD-GYP domain-containing protein (c-di-GMP phosphodiesterase class II)